MPEILSQFDMVQAQETETESSWVYEHPLDSE